MEEEIETKKKRKWPKVLIWVGVIVFIAGAIAANIYYMRLQTPAISKEKLNIMTVKGKTMKETMIASGKVVPADIAYVYRAPSKGGIAEVFVQEGDKVQKGDRLLRYKGTGMGELDSLRLQKERLQMQMDHREEKIADLAEQIDDAKAEGLPDSAIEQLKNQKDEAAFQNEMSRLELEQVNTQIEAAEDKQDALVVTSEISGVVQSVAEQPDSSGTGTGPLITIISKPYEIQGTLSEYEVVRVKTGQPVTIQAKALGDREWKGKVAEVGTVPVQSNAPASARGGQNVTAYPFTVTLDKKAKNWRPGFHVTTEIVIDKHENVPVLPYGTIVTTGEKEYVFVLKNGKLDRRFIETGLVNGKYKEVTEGVGIGDRVVLHPQADFEDGMKVVSKDDQPQ